LHNNRAPGLHRADVSAAEDTAIFLDVNDFGTFSDIDGDTLAKVKITQLETNGSLEYWNGSAWAPIVLNQEVSKAALDAQFLRFVPDGNENGSPYATIGFKVSDGIAYSTDSYTLTVDVTPVNDPPSLTGDLAASISQGATYILTTADLFYTDVDDIDAGVTFTVSNQTNGKVQVNGVDATTFTGTQLAAGQVTFIHDNSATAAASFEVNVEDGNEDGSVPVNSTFNFTVSATPNNAPVNTVPGALSVNEDTALAFTGANAISVNDVDGNLASTQLSVTNGTLNVTLSGAATISAGGNGTSTLTISGSQADINATLASLSYQGTANYHGSDTLTPWFPPTARPHRSPTPTQ
jgi:hypothetical protein